MPRILCWKCRKLTPFELDRCEHCGSPFAGSTGGVYGSDRRSRPRATSTPKPSSGPRKRTLLEIVEDLRHVNEGTTSVRGRPREKELSVRLYQCPTCGRFVSEQSTECVCGVRFAPMSADTFSCPECGSRVPSDVRPEDVLSRPLVDVSDAVRGDLREPSRGGGRGERAQRPHGHDLGPRRQGGPGPRLVPPRRIRRADARGMAGPRRADPRPLAREAETVPLTAGPSRAAPPPAPAGRSSSDPSLSIWIEGKKRL